MEIKRSLEEIVETLQNARARGKGCTLLVGAGCSVKAGIPLASGFVEEIKKRYGCAYSRAKEKTYPKCMAELLLSERRDLIAEYVDKAKINWAHICIALLIQAGYVDRVLTTNFDLLVVRACAMLGEFPAAYDFAASQLFKGADIPSKAVFYLHGQYTGFILINTEEAFQKHSELLGPVFEDAGRGRAWIVVGYSGENDPVFDHLAKVKQFDNGLFWICYQDNEPHKHVREKLLITGKDAFYIKGFDADSFFITLTQKLNIFPPKIISHPFTHLNNILKKLTSYPIITESLEDVTRIPRQWIRHAIDSFENRTPINAAAKILLMSGDYDRVFTFRDQYDNEPSPDLGKTLSWAYLKKGYDLYDHAKDKTVRDADNLLEQAGRMYQEALEINPSMGQALLYWGISLYQQAKIRIEAETDDLYKQATEKFQAALAINPNNHEALFYWGNAFLNQAKNKTNQEADVLFKQAVEKYQAVLAIKPDYGYALCTWGIVLSKQAEKKTGEEADTLFNLAGEKFHEALNIKPDMHEALTSWGTSLLYRIRTTTGEEVETLFDLAKAKLLVAEKIKPGSGAYNLACWHALRGDEEGCREWLAKSQELGTLPDRAHLLADLDLGNVRDKDWFKTLVNGKQAP